MFVVTTRPMKSVVHKFDRSTAVGETEVIIFIFPS